MINNKLTFCIPTYNRAEFLGQTLKSISDQVIEIGLTNSIEICVSDNASTDNTDEIIRSFRENYPSINLVYSKNIQNLGADRNYLKVVNLASGEYCWLFGSDDCLADGALIKIVESLNSEIDIYLGNRINCSFNLEPINKFNWLKCEHDRVFDFSSENELLEYFGLATSLGAVFSYLSSIIVRKSAWSSVVYSESMTGTAYSHVYILLSIIVNYDVKLMYLNEALILCRLDNDSFATEGNYKRFLLDIDGYLKLSEILQNSDLRRSFLFILKREHPWYRLANMRHLGKLGWEGTKEKLLRVGYSRFTICSAETFAAIPILLPLALRLKRFFVAVRS